MSLPTSGGAGTRLRVLGCSGGIGAFARTTSFLVDDDVLLDAGTGVEDLTVEQIAAIDHVFLTHSHLDHVCMLPLMADSAGALRERPLVVHALPETIAALRAHVFNWTIWPDFTRIPDPRRPFLVFEPIGAGQAVRLPRADGALRTVHALPATHTVPALGYRVSAPGGSLVFSGDTVPDEAFWRAVNAVPDLRVLIIETAFAERERVLAARAGHLSPVQLARQLGRLERDARVLVTHLKPADRAVIEQEIAEAFAGRRVPAVLERGQVIEVG